MVTVLIGILIQILVEVTPNVDMAVALVKCLADRRRRDRLLCHLAPSLVRSASGKVACEGQIDGQTHTEHWPKLFFFSPLFSCDLRRLC